MEVRARAPGKVILSGEHFVVHGSTAVAASINRYTYVSFLPSGALLSPIVPRFGTRGFSRHSPNPAGTGDERRRILQRSSRKRVTMEVRARAPGKVILSGEHAVVHGSTAVAASINRYTYVSFLPSGTLLSPTDSDGGSVVIGLKDMELVFSWPLQRLKEKLPSLGPPVLSSPHACTPEMMKCISELIEEQNIPEAKMWIFPGLSVFLHLYTSIQGLKAGKVVVSSDLSPGSGLGSSAAFCVSVAAALLAPSVVNLDSRSDEWIRLADNDLELVNKWAFEGERIIHGKPSGIDNTVSTFGNMIAFRLGELNHIKSTTPIRILITNTKVGRNTKALVAGVSKRATRHPDAMATVFTAVDSISKELSSIIQQPALDDTAIIEKEEKLEELMQMNQGLLQCMGVSHSSIETVLQTTLKYKLSSKLTGAGGGGCVLTLVPMLPSSVIMDKVVQELQSCGFECFMAEVGGKGMEADLMEEMSNIFFRK